MHVGTRVLNVQWRVTIDYWSTVSKATLASRIVSSITCPEQMSLVRLREHADAKDRFR